MIRSSTRLKIPESTKSIVIIRSIQDLALFEESNANNLLDPKNQSNKKIKEIEDKNSEIHKALKEKEVILVPKTNQTQSEIKKPIEGNKSHASTLAPGEVITKEGHFGQSLFKKDITRTSYYLKYQNDYATFRTNNSIYEASNDDKHFLTELQGCLFNIQDFEYIIISFEEETKFDDIKKEVIFYINLARNLFQGTEIIEDGKFELNVHRIFEYWKEKRKERKKSFLRKYFWRKPILANLSENNDLFKPYGREKRNLRKNKKALPDLLLKIKELKLQLESIKELISLCKHREVCKSKYYEGNFLELFIKLKSELVLLGKNHTIKPFIDITILTKEAEELINKSPNLKKPSSQIIRIKPEAEEEEGSNLIMNGREITVNHEYACIISYIVQYYDSTLLPKQEPPAIIQGIKKTRNIEYLTVPRESVNGIQYIKREETNLRNFYPNPIFHKEILKKRMEIACESLKENNFKWSKLIKANRNQLYKDENKSPINGNINYDKINIKNVKQNTNTSNYSNGLIIKGPLGYYSKFFSKFCSELLVFPENDMADLNKLKKDHSQLFEEMKNIQKNRKK